MNSVRRSNVKCYTVSKMSSVHKINTVQVLSYAQTFISIISHVGKESLIFSCRITLTSVVAMCI
jgi:carbonic anhydrase/acetyltransferase-like protein (isoleucine patch superfamily)